MRPTPILPGFTSVAFHVPTFVPLIAAVIVSPLQANGVPNGARWAIEAIEYRPYSTGGPSPAKLRANLAKYNPSPEVVDKIVASLSL